MQFVALQASGPKAPATLPLYIHNIPNKTKIFILRIQPIALDADKQKHEKKQNKTNRLSGCPMQKRNAKW